MFVMAALSLAVFLVIVLPTHNDDICNQICHIYYPNDTYYIDSLHWITYSENRCSCDVYSCKQTENAKGCVLIKTDDIEIKDEK